MPWWALDFDSGKNSNLHGFEVHRPSSKGTKLLFQVIKAIINQWESLSALFVLWQVMESWKHSCQFSATGVRSYSPPYPSSSTPLNPPPPLLPFPLFVLLFVSFLFPFLPIFYFFLFFPSPAPPFSPFLLALFHVCVYLRMCIFGHSLPVLWQQ